MVRQRDETPTELIFGEELVNTSDATVKRIHAERASLSRAMANAERLYQNQVTTYNAMFVNRVSRILQDADVQLEALPAQFQENAESPS